MNKPGDIHQRLVNLKSLLDRINRSWATRDYEDLMQFFVEIFPGLFKAERCGIFLTNTDSEDIWLKFGTGLREKEIIAPRSGSIVGKAITTGQVVIQGRLDQIAGFHQEVDKKTEFTTRNILCVPIISIVGNYTLGAVEILNKVDPEDFDDADVVLMGRIVKFLALSIENNRVSEEIIRISRGMHDQITRTGEILKGKHRFIAQSSPMRHVLEIASKIGPLPVNVFITGASGTGKEVIARLIHESAEDRRSRPFVAVNCSSIPETLMESEFFGYEKGAFTGAVSSRMGRFEEASGGTLFLDEIADMPLSIQPKFLRAIQENEGTRLGGQKIHHYQFRIISASSRDLREEVSKGRFREDLFFRLFSVDITIPPLCERRDDIAPLALMFLDEINSRFNKNVMGFSSDIMDLFENYDWPGNVRQLQHEVERLVALTPDHEMIPMDHCSLRGRSAAPEEAELDSLSLPEHRRRTEIRLILKALQKTKGNKIQAAALLDITRQSLHNKIKLYKIEKSLGPTFPLTEG
ncbi:MAG: sigma-54-dependent Fis family transcriptional regulator [Magnetococcales bacterium]|nr:sigma-54-dependent Fis family transcriptional regulator [Magnetococcales bacterium]